MSKKLLTIGAVVLAGALVLGALTAWLLPGEAEAAQGRQGGKQLEIGEQQGQGSWQTAGNLEAYDGVRRNGGGQGQSQGRGQGQGLGQGQEQAPGQSADMSQGLGQGGNQDPVDHAPIWDKAYDEPLSDSEIEALLMALEDEYKAWAVYDQVIADFGAARPFTSIQKAEENHIAALETLLDRYDLEVPDNEWVGSVPTFDTLADACQAGVDAELDNADLYDQLFDMVDNPDIIQVFTSLQQASQTKHLTAFERCAD